MSSKITISNPTLAAIVARMKAAQAAAACDSPIPPSNQPSPSPSHELSTSPSLVPSGLASTNSPAVIKYNATQQEFISTAATGTSCVLVGSAGTGKTTAQNGLVSSLISSGASGILGNTRHKYLIDGAPGIVVVAYTRRAVRNIRRRMPESLQDNCITIHKLLEYSREFRETVDPMTGDMKTIPVFQPTRNMINPLPDTIRTIIFEESSMISVDLFAEVVEALAHPIQSIFLGDLEQLPPVFGKAILGYKLWEFPVFELTEVYRQALDSPIIKLAHRILGGDPIKKADALEMSNGGLTFKFWQRSLMPEVALSQAANYMCKEYDSGAYDPESDVILTPQNVGFGTVELNKYIANHIARKNQVVTFEIIAGFMKHCLSEGDKVLYNKEDATVIKILPNPTYYGVKPQPESEYLNYWGVKVGEPAPPEYAQDEADPFDSESFDWESLNLPAIEDKTNQASHRIQLCLEDTGDIIWIDKSAEVNSLDMAYAMTVHKAQGSEWDKVYFMTHASQARMMYRELLYTAVTRAKKELFILCESETFVKGIQTQRIKGKGWRAKAEAFKGKQ